MSSNRGFVRPDPPATRDLWDMRTLASIHGETPDLVTPAADGRYKSLPRSTGFHCEYNPNVALGGWDYLQIDPRLAIAITDMIPEVAISRRHVAEDCLVLTTMVKGGFSIWEGDDTEVAAESATGFCTVYGLKQDDHVHTRYDSGHRLRWLSVFIDRLCLAELLAEDDRSIPADVRRFLAGGERLRLRNVPLSPIAMMTVRQMLDQPFEGAVRKLFLSAKAQEFCCHILASLADIQSDDDRTAFSASDYQKVQAARRLLRARLDQPPKVSEIAQTVGLTRQRLQNGFRIVYGDTVGQVRDKLRMELALDLVQDSQASMIEIAMETGYEHPASFTRAFKQAFGCSPIEARREAQLALRTRIEAKRQ
ncbi:MAG: helix-turn-helix transcriptional regulator [Sphingopyxis sp.]|nr:helix-turn-helix transcriptional regulator [Sphingopyxis sp.]